MKFNKYEFRLFLIRFIIIGLIGAMAEVYWQGFKLALQSIKTVGFIDFVCDLNTYTQGHTCIFTPLLYGIATVPFTFLFNPLNRLSKILEKYINKYIVGFIRKSILALSFMSIEFIVGIIMLKVLDYRAWNYTQLPLNIMGVITFAYFPAWLFLSYVGEFIHIRLKQIDDVIYKPNDWNIIKK